MKNVFLLLTLFWGISTLNAQTFEETTPMSFVRELELTSSDVADINGDGKLDIVVMGNNTVLGKRLTYIYLNDANEKFKLATNAGIESGFIWGWINIGDQDNDGDMDIVMQGWDNTEGDAQKCYVYNNNGTGIFTKVAELAGRSNGSIEWGDYDNDGDLDLLQTGWFEALKTGYTTIYKNEGNNTFTAIEHTVEGLADGQARWGDVDGDGKLDIVLSGWNKTQIYKGDGAGGFTKTSFSLPQNYDFAWIDLIDYNKDNKLDIVLAGLVPASDPAAWQTKVYKGNGDGTFEDSNMNLFGVQRGPIVTGDSNKDGFTDFFVSGWAGAGHFKIYNNDGTNQNFTEVAGVNDVISGWADGTLQVADFDGDGYDEIFKSGWNQTALYANTAAATAIIDKTNANGITVAQNGDYLVINSNQQSGQYDVQIYEMSGRIVFQEKYSNSEIIVPIGTLAKGCYLVRVRNSKFAASKMVLIR